MSTEKRGWDLKMSQSIPVRSRGMQKGRQQILVYLTLSMLVIGVSAIIVSEFTPVQERTEYLCIKTFLRNSGDMTGVVILFDENNNFLEEFVIFNITEWQSSIYSYSEGDFVYVYIDFWYLDDFVDRIEYEIGRGLISIQTTNVMISINSFVDRPR